MSDPNMTLFAHAIEPALRDLAAGAEEAAWAAIAAARTHYGVEEDADEELHLAIELCDAEALTAIHDTWFTGERLMLVRDRDVLKRAMKAFRKSLKVTILDAESSVAGGPMSAGRKSQIVGIVPPPRYPREVWDELVRQKKLVADKFGTYELAPGM